MFYEFTDGVEGQLLLPLQPASTTLRDFRYQALHFTFAQPNKAGSLGTRLALTVRANQKALLRGPEVTLQDDGVSVHQELIVSAHYDRTGNHLGLVGESQHLEGRGGEGRGGEGNRTDYSLMPCRVAHMKRHEYTKFLCQ